MYQVVDLEWDGEPIQFTLNAPRVDISSKLSGLREIETIANDLGEVDALVDTKEKRVVWLGKGVILACLMERSCQLFSERDTGSACSIWLPIPGSDGAWLVGDVYNGISEREYYLTDEYAVTMKLNADNEGQRRRLVIAPTEDRAFTTGFDATVIRTLQLGEIHSLMAGELSANLLKHVRLPRYSTLRYGAMVSGGAIGCLVLAYVGYSMLFGQTYVPPPLPPVTGERQALVAPTPTPTNPTTTATPSNTVTPAAVEFADRSSIRWDLHAFTLLAKQPFIREHQFTQFTWDRPQGNEIILYFDGTHPHLWDGLARRWSALVIERGTLNTSDVFNLDGFSSMLTTLQSRQTDTVADLPRPVVNPTEGPKRLLKVAAGGYDYRLPNATESFTELCQRELGTVQVGANLPNGYLNSAITCDVNWLRYHAWQRGSVNLAHGHLRYATCNYSNTSLEPSQCQLVWVPVT